MKTRNKKGENNDPCGTFEEGLWEIYLSCITKVVDLCERKELTQ